MSKRRAVLDGVRDYAVGYDGERPTGFAEHQIHLGMPVVVWMLRFGSACGEVLAWCMFHRVFKRSKPAARSEVGLQWFTLEHGGSRDFDFSSCNLLNLDLANLRDPAGSEQQWAVWL